MQSGQGRRAAHGPVKLAGAVGPHQERLGSGGGCIDGAIKADRVTGAAAQRGVPREGCRPESQPGGAAANVERPP